MMCIAGSRMIAKGRDGVSRGKLPNKTLDRSLQFFVPLNLSAIERSLSSLEWVHTWTGETFVNLQPKHYFAAAYDLRFIGKENKRNLSFESSTYSWTPPPLISDVTLEQLRHARSKRQTSIHIMIILKLFCSLWQR